LEALSDSSRSPRSRITRLPGPAAGARHCSERTAGRWTALVKTAGSSRGRWRPREPRKPDLGHARRNYSVKGVPHPPGNGKEEGSSKESALGAARRTNLLFSCSLADVNPVLLPEGH